MDKNQCDELLFYSFKKQLHAMGRLSFAIASDSMTPLIKVGDLIDVALLATEPKKFDIIVFWTGKVLMAHFVWHKNRIKDGGNDCYLTRSLKAPLESDDPVATPHILGVVVNHRISMYNRLLLSFRIFLNHRM